MTFCATKSFHLKENIFVLEIFSQIKKFFQLFLFQFQDHKLEIFKQFQHYIQMHALSITNFYFFSHCAT